MTIGNLEPGLSRAEIEERLGRPDEVEYLQNSFRPPGSAEDRRDYEKALREWEQKTPGESWSYEQPRVSLSLSKAGKLLDWSED